MVPNYVESFEPKKFIPMLPTSVKSLFLAIIGDHADEEKLMIISKYPFPMAFIFWNEPYAVKVELYNSLF